MSSPTRNRDPKSLIGIDTSGSNRRILIARNHDSCSPRPGMASRWSAGNRTCAGREGSLGRRRVTASGPRAVEIVPNGTLKTYAGFPHGMPTTHADTINPDLPAFIQS